MHENYEKRFHRRLSNLVKILKNFESTNLKFFVSVEKIPPAKCVGISIFLILDFTFHFEMIYIFFF